MNAYYSTFISGFGKVIRKELSKILSGAEILELFDGLVVYKTNVDIDTVYKIRFFNNSYVLIEMFRDCSLEEAVSKVLNGKTLKESIKKELNKIGNSFRIIFSDENQIVSIDKSKIQKLEKLLTNGVKIDRANPKTEPWFIKRSEGNCFVGIRITRPEDFEKHLAKGELRPELAHPYKDVFLDPFAGSGAIVFERMKHFPYKKVLAGEKDKQVFKRFQERLEKEKS